MYDVYLTRMCKHDCRINYDIQFAVCFILLIKEPMQIKHRLATIYWKYAFGGFFQFLIELNGLCVSNYLLFKCDLETKAI